MEYKFFRDGVWEEVIKEKWWWEAHYADSTALKQFDDKTGLFHQFKEIDQNKLINFKMMSEDKTCFTLLFEPEKMSLIHYYKNVRLNLGGSNETFIKVYCFGYGIKNKADKTIIMLMPSGEAIVTKNPDLIDFK